MTDDEAAKRVEKIKADIADARKIAQYAGEYANARAQTLAQIAIADTLILAIEAALEN